MGNKRGKRSAQMAPDDSYGPFSNFRWAVLSFYTPWARCNKFRGRGRSLTFQLPAGSARTVLSEEKLDQLHEKFQIRRKRGHPLSHVPRKNSHSTSLIPRWSGEGRPSVSPRSCFIWKCSPPKVTSEIDLHVHESHGLISISAHALPFSPFMNKNVEERARGGGAVAKSLAPQITCH